jgi:sigma-B regulation protein RsbU (phosphoserine phosphatase)
MITCFYGEIDPATGGLIYVNAGHNPPYLYDGDERRTLDPTAVVLGMIDGMPFPKPPPSCAQARGCCFTPTALLRPRTGSVSSSVPSGSRPPIGGPRRSEPAGALDAIIATVVRFRGTARQSDDITMMLVSREGAA